ncbi:MAG TPA: type VI secretion system baseplate subunit TssF [Terriglobia bacterium]|nr:type VI secretion system baseplate subunit TssF [Terriglobia bacterium]
MRDELRDYFERELTFLRQMGAEFAETHPKIAARLLLEPDGSKDPHVERMIESFAFLAARVHLKVDDEFPEITEALLGILYPHYLRPVPSMSVAQFHLDPEQGKLTTGLAISRGSMLYSRPVGDMPCKFRTCYDITLWPFTVSEAQWGTPDRLEPPVKSRDTVAFLKIELTCLPDVSFDKLEINSLQFHLNGEGALVHTLYELLSNNCARILVRDPERGLKAAPRVLPPGSLVPLGFSEDDALLPYPRRSFMGYRLVQEYFSFPEKFFFFELRDFDASVLGGFKNRVEIIFLISPFELSDRQQKLEVGVTPGTIRLGCSPVINLFPQTAEPILLDQTRSEYAVVPDARRRHATEVFSVDEVVVSNPQSHEVTSLESLYSFRHGSRGRKEQVYWHATRRPSARKNDEGTDVFLSLVDLSSRPALPASDTVTVRCTCSNRDLPFRLPFGNEAGDFEVEGVPSIKRIIALKKPTRTVRPPLGSAALWRLISHLSLNYLSLVDDGKEALKEILKLYNFSGLPEAERQIEGLAGLHSRRHFARVVSENGISFVRGTHVTAEFDEEHFSGGGVYLFAKVLEYFLGLYASMNSFTQLAATTKQRREALHEWPPRAGQTILV